MLEENRIPAAVASDESQTTSLLRMRGGKGKLVPLQDEARFSGPAKERPIDPDAILRANLERVRKRADDAARRAGRPPGAVRLVAVTKTVEADIVSRLARLGVHHVGENRIQVASDKLPHVELESGSSLEWHLIGHLQANKSRRALELFGWIHSIDSAKLFERVAAIAREISRAPRVLLQVNVSGEESKHGFTPEQLFQFLSDIRGHSLSPVGLMTMAPLVSDPEQTRPVFRRLREIRDEIVSRRLVESGFDELSMGMSDDFEIAVEEGATLIRVGRTLFQGLPNAEGD